MLDLLDGVGNALRREADLQARAEAELGAAGVLMGTRFLATPEAPLADPFKKAILDSDGTDTIVSDISDILIGGNWPGAYARVARNRLVDQTRN